MVKDAMRRLRFTVLDHMRVHGISQVDFVALSDGWLSRAQVGSLLRNQLGQVDFNIIIGCAHAMQVPLGDLLTKVGYAPQEVPGGKPLDKTE